MKISILSVDSLAELNYDEITNMKRFTREDKEEDTKVEKKWKVRSSRKRNRVVNRILFLRKERKK